MLETLAELSVHETKSFAQLALELSSNVTQRERPRVSFLHPRENRIEADELSRAPVATHEGFMEDILRQQLPQLEINAQTFWVAEGDLRLDAAQLHFYAAQRLAMVTAWQQKNRHYEPGFEVVSVTRAAVQDLHSTGLLGIAQGGRIIRWQEGVVLKYCVLKNTFTTGNSQQHYEKVVEAMRQATGDWEQACAVRFAHVTSLDNHPSTDLLHPDFRAANIVFLVQEFVLPGDTIAMAFFPNDPKSRRSIYIDPQYYEPNAVSQPVGVLRHEIGHILGFRHEHIRSGAPPECQGESLFETIPLTAYDPQSIMHYFCGENQGLLQITDLDRLGARKVYGPPLPPTAGFCFVGV